jgi:glycosyltransferase involved in cell wall biosynthesis
MTLSVVHISTADREGGSARSAYRIHDGLRRRGHRSRMLVGYKVTDDADVATVSGSPAMKRLDRLADAVTARLGLQYQWMPSGYRVLRHEWLQSPSVIQLYNTHGGYISHRLLPRLARRAPIVWRLSDMWPVTGHCAYAGPCERWSVGCGHCPDLATYPAVGHDATGYLWRQKRQLYRKSRLTVVAPSSWIEGIARAAPLFEGAAVHRIPNGLDQAMFRPSDRDAARAVLGIRDNRTAVLFAAHVADANPRKGTDLLEAALHRLGPRADMTLLVAGVGSEKWAGRVPQAVIPLGYLRDDRLLAAANSAADFVVVPSSVENLPNSVIEAFACARPAVAFDAGGIRDAVRDGETGLLVPAGDSEGLSAALARMLDDSALRQALGARALDLARREYSAEVQAARFEALYLSLSDGPPQ